MIKLSQKTRLSYLSVAFFRLLLLFGLFVFWACENVGTWSPPAKNCNPLQFPVIRDSILHEDTFVAKGGAVGCLQVAWGESLKKGIGKLVYVEKQGFLKPYDGDTGKIAEGSLVLNTPSEADGQPHHFHLFLFGRAAQDSTRQKTICQTDMNTPDYQCDLDEKGDCWFSLLFQPSSENPKRLAAEVPGLCRIFLPKSSTRKENISGDIEVHSEEKESFPEENLAPEKDAGPENITPESVTAEEVTAELTPEIADLPKEQVSEEPSLEKAPPERMAPPEKRQVSDQVFSSVVWAKKAGSSAHDWGYAVAVDRQGNVIVVGSFQGTASFGVASVTSSGSSDIFVAKMDSSGKWLWVQKAGSVSSDIARGVDVDALGNIVITGDFGGSILFGSNRLKPVGKHDAFVAKLDSSGKWLWAKSIGSSDTDRGFGVVVDSQSNIVVVGSYESSINMGKIRFTATGSKDAFVIKFDKSGTGLWGLSLGGLGHDEAFGVDTDSQDNIAVIGRYQRRFPFGSQGLQCKGTEDTFVGLLDKSGKHLWVRRIGGNDTARGLSIAVGPKDNIHVTGFFKFTTYFGSEALTVKGPSSEIFISKLTNKGSWLWTRRAGGPKNDYGQGIAVDKQGNVSITGYFWGVSTFGATKLTAPGSFRDVFVSKLDTSGKWLWSKQAGNTGEEAGQAIAVDAKGYIYVTGYFGGTVSFQGSSVSSTGGKDIFVWKIK